MSETISASDIATLESQLGREPRGLVGIGARCVCGAPLVATTAPRLPDGTPFPTMYYLSHPQITAAVSRLEADGVMAEFNERLADDPEFAAAYQRAHTQYLAQRSNLEGSLRLQVREIAGISAGGMPTRVKCLHALVGHSLAAGPGVNPVGDAALAMIGYDPALCFCKPD